MIGAVTKFETGQRPARGGREAPAVLPEANLRFDGAGRALPALCAGFRSWKTNPLIACLKSNSILGYSRDQFQKLDLRLGQTHYLFDRLC